MYEHEQGRRTTTISSSSSSSSSSSIYISTSATCRSENLWITYRDCIGEKPSPMILRAMCTWCERVGYEVLEYALMETAAAPRPSWRYAQAILRQCEGLRIEKRPGETIYQAIKRARYLKEAVEAREARKALKDAYPSS